jgi:hypothetical protein
MGPSWTSHRALQLSEEGDASLPQVSVIGVAIQICETGRKTFTLNYAFSGPHRRHVFRLMDRSKQHLSR